MRFKLIAGLMAVMCWLPSFAQDDVELLLIARNLGTKGLASGDTVRVFGFAYGLGDNPGVPGPTITVNQGDSVHIDLFNISQGAPHTIHLHGLDVDQENDGVPHLSWDVPHMDHGIYHFEAPHPGTYLYHCHVASTVHVQAGMYGLIIVRPPDGSNTTWEGGHAFDLEFSYFLSEIDTFWHQDGVMDHPHDSAAAIHYVSIPKFDPQFFLINGFSDQQLAEEGIALSSAVGAVNYLRFANIGYCGNRIIFPPELNAVVVASDGRPLPQQEVTDTLYVYPGERYGVLTEASEEFTDAIRMEYIDMNTLEVKNTQQVPVTVSGYFSIEEVSSERVGMVVFPNPFENFVAVNVDMKRPGNVELRMFDTNGRIVEALPTQRLGRGQHEFKLGSQAHTKGVYYIQLNLNGQREACKKVIRQ